MGNITSRVKKKLSSEHGRSASNKGSCKLDRAVSMPALSDPDPPSQCKTTPELLMTPMKQIPATQTVQERRIHWEDENIKWLSPVLAGSGTISWDDGPVPSHSRGILQR